MPLSFCGAASVTVVNFNSCDPRHNKEMHLAAAIAALWAGAVSPTFSGDVAPILYRQCAACHRPGGVAPFSLLTYEDASRRAALIAKVTASRYMPPWLPVEPHFADERRLTDAEIGTLARWAAAGAARGAGAGPPVPQFPDGWQLGPPNAEAE